MKKVLFIGDFEPNEIKKLKKDFKDYTEVYPWKNKDVILKKTEIIKPFNRFNNKEGILVTKNDVAKYTDALKAVHPVYNKLKYAEQLIYTAQYMAVLKADGIIVSTHQMFRYEHVIALAAHYANKKIYHVTNKGYTKMTVFSQEFVN